MLTEPREAHPRSSTYQVTPGQPGWIDLTTLDQVDGTRLDTKAIFVRRDEFLIYTVAAPGLPRPTRFATSAGDGQTLVVLKLVAHEQRPAGDVTGTAWGRGTTTELSASRPVPPVKSQLAARLPQAGSTGIRRRRPGVQPH